ncbi:MAG: hypothetical protein ACOH14_01205 [Rhodoglobus sp.]
MTALRDRGDDAPRNLALSAGYGLGKSSVIRGVVRAFPRRVVHVTLGSLKRGLGASLPTQPFEQAKAEVQSIQQEVVKQLLYSAKQSELPRSRFRRVDRFRTRAILPIVIPVVGIALLLVYNSELALRVEEFFGRQEWPIWSLYLGGWVALSAAFVVLLSSLGAVVRVGKVTAGSNSIELTGDNADTGFFDRYLDELVYFFQQTKRDIVVFEDIDRFGNAEVFEELRELNTLLNQAAQIRRKPIRFVYSVRDSLFDEWPSDSDGNLPLSLRRATQRMKFFDLVVPMVPSITHRTARDVLKDFRETQLSESLSESLVQEVASLVPDMRVLAGILNEFKVFRSLTTGPNHPELDATESFAVLVYKVHESADFELIQFNASALDRISDHAEAIVEARAAVLVRLLRSWDEKAETRKAEGQLAEAASLRLGAALEEQLRISEISAPATWSVDDEEQALDATSTPGFWHLLTENTEAEVKIEDSTQGAVWVIPALKVLEYAQVSAKSWKAGASAAARQQYESLRNEQRVFARATWAELFQRDELTQDGVTFAAKVNDCFADPIVPRLIELGHLNEGFYLHSSVFYGKYMGDRATTYLHKYVNRRQISMNFDLDVPTDIHALIETLDSGFLAEQDAALNVSLVDAIVNTGAAPKFFRRYQAPRDLEIEFAEAYLRSGADLGAFIRGIATEWAGVFDFALQPQPDSLSTPATRLTDVLTSARANLPYWVEAGRREALRIEIQNLPLLREPLSAESADRVAVVLNRLGLEIEQLETLGGLLFAAVRDAGGFALTYENLKILGGGEVALDVFMEHESVLQRIETDIGGYLDIIEEQSSTSVSDVSLFESVVERFASIAEEELERLSRLAGESAEIVVLDKLGTHTWGPLIRAGRVRATMKVASDYFDMFGQDETFIEFLETSLTLDPADASQSDRRTVAAKLLAADEVSVESRVRVIVSLTLDSLLSSEDILIDDDSLPAKLVAAGVVGGGEEELQWAHAAGFEALRGVLNASPASAEYIAQLPLGAEDLTKIFQADSGVPEAARLAINKEISVFESALTRDAWKNYARWANDAEEPVEDAILVALPRHGVPVELVLDLLIQSFATRSSELIEGVLEGLGGQYAEITTVRRGSETFDRSTRMASLAELLVARGIARSWHYTITKRVQIFRFQA